MIFLGGFLLGCAVTVAIVLLIHVSFQERDPASEPSDV